MGGPIVIESLLCLLPTFGFFHPSWFLSRCLLQFLGWTSRPIGTSGAPTVIFFVHRHGRPAAQAIPASPLLQLTRLMSFSYIYIHSNTHPMISSSWYSGVPLKREDGGNRLSLSHRCVCCPSLVSFTLLGFFLGVYYSFLAGPLGPLVSVELPLSYSLYTGTAALPHRPYQRARYYSRLV